VVRKPNPRLQRTRSASPPSPLSRQPLGALTLSGQKVSRATLVALSASLLIACPSRMQTPSHYDKHGISFSLPARWSVTDDELVVAEFGIRHINIDGPQHAVIDLSLLPPASTKTLAGFAVEVMQRMRANAEKRVTATRLNSASIPISFSAPEAVNDDVAGRVREGVLLRFVSNLYGGAQPHELRLYVVEGGKYKVLIMWQAPTDELPAVREGAESVLRSLQIGSRP
jgi:hypothetical protein